MRSTFEFLNLFKGGLRQAGIPFALTSGLACVHYGLQQSTKDSDWIIAEGHLETLRRFLARKEGELPPWRVSYRAIFGAPLDAQFMVHGWTSHLSIWDSAGGPEHHLDFFSKPPRIKELEADSEGWCSRETVALMKKTDRERDWPMVDGLAWQMQSVHEGEPLVHLQDEKRLIALWRDSEPEARKKALLRRPWLNRLDRDTDPDRVFALIRVERTIWECVNQERYGAYQRAWKVFYRRWRTEEDWQWPTSESFARQHDRLLAASAKYELAPDPVGSGGKRVLLGRARERAARRTGVAPGEISEISPPDGELLP